MERHQKKIQKTPKKKFKKNIQKKTTMICLTKYRFDHNLLKCIVIDEYGKIEHCYY